MGKPFTDKLIANLKPKDKKYLVAEGRGFNVRVLPSGVKTFLYIYHIEGKRKQLNLGIYPVTTLLEARQKYNEAFNLVAKGIDPQEHNKAEAAAKERETHSSFGHFASLYLEHSEKRHSDAVHKIAKLSLNNDVLPFWKDVKITEIRRRDAIALLERVAARSKGQVSNVHKAARGVFNYAVDREYIDANPMDNLSKAVPELKQVARERVLTDVEITQIWPNLPTYLKLILLTAQRPGEVAGMHMREIQLESGGGWWTIPEERTKSGAAHMVYLTPTALELIGDAEGYVFPSPKNDGPVDRMALSRYVHRANYYDLLRWTPHDLRRTARTNFSRLGIAEEHAEAVIAHSKRGIVKVYNKYEYQHEKKQTLLAWEAALLKLLSAQA